MSATNCFHHPPSLIITVFNSEHGLKLSPDQGMSGENEVIENPVADISSDEEQNVRDEEEALDTGSFDYTSDNRPDGPSNPDHLLKEEQGTGNVPDRDNNVENVENIEVKPVGGDCSEDSLSYVEEPVPDEGRDLEVDIVEPITSVEEPEIGGVSHSICCSSCDLPSLWSPDLLLQPFKCSCNSNSATISAQIKATFCFGPLLKANWQSLS